MRPVHALFLVALLLCPACGGNTVTSPSTPTPTPTPMPTPTPTPTPTPIPTPFTGHWVGTYADTPASGGDAGAFGVTLAQSDSSVTGTWDHKSTSTGQTDDGSLTGTASGDSLVATLAPNDPQGCSFTLTVSLSDSTHFAGHYTSLHCSSAIIGSVTAARQP